MERVVFNPAQREVLDVMSCIQTDEDLQALKARGHLAHPMGPRRVAMDRPFG